MKNLTKLIRFPVLLFLLLILQDGFCTGVTGDTLSKNNPFTFDILSEIERDLKVCDLVKQQNVDLQKRVAVSDYQIEQYKSEIVQTRKEAKKEKRKRIVGAVIRTVLEVGVLVAIIIL